MASLGNALQELCEDRSATQLRLEKLNQAISAIESLNGSGTTGESFRPKRIMSAASRRKMAWRRKRDGQRRRVERRNQSGRSQQRAN